MQNLEQSLHYTTMVRQQLQKESVQAEYLTVQSKVKVFGFDPIFIPADLDADGEALPVGEMGDRSTHGTPFGGISMEEKQHYSHRRRALSSLLSHLDIRG